MAGSKNIRRWFVLHRWTSLICTVFLLMLCITGLPLIFQEELDHWLDRDPPYESLPANTPMANLDSMVNASARQYPGLILTSIFVDDDEPQVIVSLAPSWNEVMKDHSDSIRWTKYDARTAKVIRQSPPPDEQHASLTEILLDLHRGMFAGLAGELFLGLMGLLFVLAIVSGVVLYGPFMKKLDFGTIRTHRSYRLKWLDLHNLLGIATAVWMFVVGATGVLNELSTPLFGIWQMTEVNDMLAPYEGKPAIPADERSSVQAALDTVKKALPDMTVTSIVFPGAPFASSQHFLLWAKGNTPLRSQLFSPALVDARTGRLSTVVKMPWYLRALEISRPLHFGDYGGMPLKIIWALFDVVAIVVLISGIYLWWKRRKAHESYITLLQRAETSTSGHA